MTVEQDSSVSMTVGVEHVAGDQERVTLSASNLPEGVTVSYSSEGGTPSFGSLITFHVERKVEVGSYPIQIAGTSASGNAKTYDMNLNVIKSSLCAVNTWGEYDGNVYTVSDGVVHFSEPVIIFGYGSKQLNKFSIKLPDLSYDIHAEMHCSDNKFYVSADNRVLWGEGIVNHATGIIKFQVNEGNGYVNIRHYSLERRK